MKDIPLGLHSACEHGDENEVRKLLKEGVSINIKREDEWVPLHLASWNGHVAIAKLLLNSGADINSKNEDELTPLHLSSVNGHEAVTKLLLDSGADVNSRGRDEETPLHLASHSGQEAVAILLLDSGADINSKQKKGWTPLHQSSRNSHEPLTKLFLDSGADIDTMKNDEQITLNLASVNDHEAVAKRPLDNNNGEIIHSRKKDEHTPLHLASLNDCYEAIDKLFLDIGTEITSKNSDEWTPLQLASANGHEAVSKLLLDNGADINSRQNYEWTPLHLSSESGHEAVAKLLLDRGADVNCRKGQWTPLHLVSLNGHEAVAKLLLESGADMISNIESEWTPLHLATVNGHEAVAKLLLESGADIYSKKDEWIPLHLASLNGHEAVAQLLLGSGTDVNSRGGNGWTPLHLVSRHGHEPVAKLLLEYKADVNNRKEDEWTPLHLASLNGHEAVTKLLLDNGANINCRKKDGWTPLHLTLLNGHETVVKLLLVNGADVNSKGEDEWTPLHLVADFGLEGVAKLLIDNGADINSRGEDEWTPLHQTSQNGHEAVTKLLLESGADVDSRQKHKWTPLHMASTNGHEAVAKILLDNGADINSKQNKGWTPLHLASRNGRHEAVAKLLLDYGADVNSRQNNEWTPLHQASENGHEAIAKLLLESGADINSRQNYEWTPLHMASTNGHEAIAKLLLESGADINSRQNYEWTPLHLASANGHVAMTKLLLNSGADVNSRHREEWTPLHLAIKNGNKTIIKLLLDRGADVNSRSKDNFTPIHLAVLMGHIDVIHQLMDLGATVPPEIIVRGSDAVKIYQDSVQNGVKSDKRCRMLVVGAERVGKTSLIKLLTGKKFNPEEKSTHVIDVFYVKASSPMSTWEIYQTQDGTTYTEQEYQDALTIAKKFKDKLTIVKQINSRKGKHLVNKMEKDFTGASQVADHFSKEVFGSSKPVQGTSQAIHDSSETAHGSSQSIHSSIKEAIDPFQAEAAVELNVDKLQNPDVDKPPISDLPGKFLVKESQVSNVPRKVRKEEPPSPVVVRKFKEAAPIFDTSEKFREEVESLVHSELGPSLNSVVPESFIKLVEDLLKEDLDSLRESILKLGIWDFGGQGLYYTCHKVFLSSASIFIVVFDLTKDMMEEATDWTEDGFTNGQVLEFWLDSVYAYTNNLLPLSVLLVGTHAGKVNENRIQQASNFIQAILKKKPYLKHIVPEKFKEIFYTVENSCEFDKNSEALKLKNYIMEKIIPRVLKKRGKRPLRWLEFEKNIKTLQSNENKVKQFATLDEVKKVAVHCKVIPNSDDEETLMMVLQFLHDIGSIIYYGKDDLALRDLVILNPDWLLKVFKRLIIVPRPEEMNLQFMNSWETLKEKHILEKNLIDFALDDLKDTKLSIIHLMKKYDFICERVRGEEITYYVPFVLVQGKQNMPDIDKRSQPKEIQLSDITAFIIDFKGFLPSGLFHQLVIKTLIWSEGCREPGAATREPDIYYRYLAAHIHSKHVVALKWMPQHNIKIFIKNCSPSPQPMFPEALICCKVLDFIKKSLFELQTMGIRSIEPGKFFDIYVDLKDYPRGRPSQCQCRPRLKLQNCLNSDGWVACNAPEHHTYIDVSVIREKFTLTHQGEGQFYQNVKPQPTDSVPDDLLAAKTHTDGVSTTGMNVSGGNIFQAKSMTVNFTAVPPHPPASGDTPTSQEE